MIDKIVWKQKCSICGTFFLNSHEGRIKCDKCRVIQTNEINETNEKHNIYI